MNNSTESEQHLIACALIDDSKTAELLEIPEEWFYINAHKLIIRTMRELVSNNLNADMFALGDSLNRSRQLEMAGGMEYLSELAESLPNLKYWNSYKTALFGYYKTRMITELNNNVSMQLGTGSNPAQIIEYMQTQLIDLLTDHHDGGPRKLDTFLDQALEDIQWKIENDGALRGQATGYDELDKTIDGFENGKVYVIAARPAMGKTQFALNVATRIARKEGGKPWIIFSLEMTGNGLAKRLISQDSRIHNNKFKEGSLNEDEMMRLASSVTRLSQHLNIEIDEQAGLTTNQIRSRLKAFQVKHGGVGGVIIDHIGLIRKDQKKDETGGMTAIAHELQIMAKEFNCPLIEVCQLNRGVEQRPDKRPMLSDIKQSGAIEEDARVVMFLYRDEYYNPDSLDAGITELKIAKNSDGEVKMIPMRSNLATGDYEEIIDWESKEQEAEADRKIKRAKF